MSDGLRTVLLVNREGQLLDVVDIEPWASAVAIGELDVPCARAHALATRGHGHVCIVLSGSREIKVFAEGRQVFAFRHASWHLMDVQARYWRWVQAVIEPVLAERLFQAALDLAEAREGALLVVLRNPAESVPALLAPVDRLGPYGPAVGPDEEGRWSGKRSPDSPSRVDLRRLVAHRNVADIAPPVLTALASMDGATVFDPAGRLLAAGAILRHPLGEADDRITVEGSHDGRNCRRPPWGGAQGQPGRCHPSLRRRPAPADVMGDHRSVVSFEL
jgi:hypothetical protein